MSNGYDGTEAHKALMHHAAEYLRRSGWRVWPDRDLFKMSVEPFIPDLVCTRDCKVRTDRGKVKRIEERRFIEIEMNPTAASIKNKENHVYNHWPKWTLIIMDARKIRGMRKGWGEVTQRAIQEWLEKYL